VVSLIIAPIKIIIRRYEDAAVTGLVSSLAQKAADAIWKLLIGN
jgi:hypothetical protein